MCCNGSSGYDSDSSSLDIERRISKQQRKVAKAEAKLAQLQSVKRTIDAHKHVQSPTHRDYHHNAPPQPQSNGPDGVSMNNIRVAQNDRKENLPSYH